MKQWVPDHNLASTTQRMSRFSMHSGGSGAEPRVCFLTRNNCALADNNGPVKCRSQVSQQSCTGGGAYCSDSKAIGGGGYAWVSRHQELRRHADALFNAKTPGHSVYCSSSEIL